MRIDNEFKNLIPPLQPDEYRQLEENILNEGIRESIITWQGIIIDGHNRFKIAEKHNLIFNTIEKEFADREAVKDWIDKNQLGRRNLTDDQRIIIIGRRYNREKERRGGDRGNQYVAKDQIDTLPTADRLSDEYKVSAPTVKRYGKTVEELEKNPENFQAVWNSEKKITDIKKEEKVKARQEQIEEIKKKIENEPMDTSGEFDVIAIDPPWAYSEKGGFSSEQHDPESNRGGVDYPTMTIEQIGNITLPLKEDAVVFLWTTHAFLRDSFELLDKWGLKYKAVVTWDKEKMGMGRTIRLQCEFCLIGVKGKPIIQGSGERDIIRESRREHSRKPEAFYSMVDRMTVGRKLDYFSREYREGWISYGAETGKF